MPLRQPHTAASHLPVRGVTTALPDELRLQHALSPESSGACYRPQGVLQSAVMHSPKALAAASSASNVVMQLCSSAGLPAV